MAGEPPAEPISTDRSESPASPDKPAPRPRRRPADQTRVRKAITKEASPAEPVERHQATTPARSRVPASVATTVGDASGFLLALLLWGWVVMPFIQGGPAGVKKVIRAKFFNQTPDGKWLP